MALSGKVETATYKPDGSSNTWKVVLDWTATQDIVNNTSTISWNIKVSTTSSTGYVVVSEVRAKINGKEVYYRNHDNHTNGYNGTQIASGTTKIKHNSNGTKSVDMSIEAGIYQWAINRSGSDTFTLTQIDRAAPTVSCATSAVSSSSLTVTATASTTCERVFLSYRPSTTITSRSRLMLSSLPDGPEAASAHPHH